MGMRGGFGNPGSLKERPRYTKCTPMNSGRIGCELAMLAVVCVLTIFLFPAMQGPYSAVNGPVTALQAARTAIRLRKAMVQSALQSLRHRLAAPGLAAPAFFSWMSLCETELHSGSLPECTSVLRC